MKLKDSSFKALCEFFTVSKLRKINLWGCKIEAEDKDSLFALFNKALLTCESLEEIDLSNTMIPDSVLEALKSWKLKALNLKYFALMDES